MNTLTNSKRTVDYGNLFEKVLNRAPRNPVQRPVPDGFSQFLATRQ